MNRNLTCVECGTRTMVPVSERYVAEIRHDGRPLAIDIPKLDYFRCSQCGNAILPDAADEVIGLEVRRLAKLLMPDQIAKLRDRFGLSRGQLAEQLDVGEATVRRWEEGTQIQSRAVDRMLRAFEALPELREYLSGGAFAPGGSLPRATVA
jgi:putative zinc finger/helix-turn-helix YgiT family protein